MSASSEEEEGNERRVPAGDDDEDELANFGARAFRNILAHQDVLVEVPEVLRRAPAVITRAPAVILEQVVGPTRLGKRWDFAASFATATIPLIRSIWDVHVLPLLGYADLLHLGATCRFFWDACDRDGLFEKCFGREKGPETVFLVQNMAHFQSWKFRFRLAQGVSNLTDAMNVAVPQDEIILMPGRHNSSSKRFFFARAMTVSIPVHLIGCCYNKNFTAHPDSWGHPFDVDRAVGAPEEWGNVVLYSDLTTPIVWDAEGGSIRNMDIRFVSEKSSQYHFGLKMDSSKPTQLELDNVCVSSQQHAAICLTNLCSMRARGIRICGAKGTGVTVHDGATLFMVESVIDHNGASGVEVSKSGKLYMERCIVHSNKLSGVGESGSREFSMIGCGVFSHRLSGVEGGSLVPTNLRSNIIHDNLNGILDWVEVDPEVPNILDVEPIRAEFVRGNNIYSNAKGNEVVVKTRKKGSSLVDTALELRVCTFTLTGPHFYAHPNMYECLSCGIAGREGICGSCASICHAGHNVVDRGAVDGFYCDDWEHDCCTFKNVIDRDIAGKGHHH